MTDHDDRLDRDLRDYYARLRQQASPDLRDRVMLATERRPVFAHRFAAVGTGLVAAAAVAAIVVLVLVTHLARTSAPVGPAHTPPPAPSATASLSATPTPTAQPVAGPPVHGFVPGDVTALSASEWWVLGEDGAACTAASCTRILHTTDGGATFTSVPVPPIAFAGSGQHDRLRFADAADGWAVDAAGVLWATHDADQHWARPAGVSTVADVEASSGSVYALSCGSGGCSIYRSPVSSDAWNVLPASTRPALRSLLVNGSTVWAVDGTASATSLIVSTDGGATFVTRSVCPGTLGISNVYAASATVLWATCATGTQAGVYLSTNGGQSFVQQGGGVQNSATIAGPSAAIAVAGSGVELQRSTDGGRTFVTEITASGAWDVIGFTTSTSGFALEQPASGDVLWHTSDAGAHWNAVRFP